VILADRGDWNAALKCFEKAAAISPEKPQYQYNLVIALRIAGRNEEAKAHMAEAKGTNGWPAAAIVTAERLVAQPGSKAFDPALAAQLATDACVASSFGNQAFLEPLSSILSNFNDSDELVRRALADASKSAHPEVEGMLKRRIDLLRQERKRAL
jgi:tetratricopeptide (TPR) repeat protein